MNHKKYRLRFKFFCNIFPQYRDTGIPWRSLKTREKRLQSWFGLPSCIPVYLLKTLKSKSAIFYIITSKKCTILKSLQGLQEHHEHTHNKTKTRVKTSSRRSSDFTLQSSGSSATRAANRAHLDSTKFLFSSKYFSQAKVPEKYGSQEIQS